MPKSYLKMFALLIVLFTTMAFTGCSKDPIENPKVQFEMDDGGIMVFELYPEYAPKTVENFVNLVELGFYDGLTFHRIREGYLIQGGDPNGDGSGGGFDRIPGEFSSNGFTKNTLEHTVGIISMARGHDYDSASSQFFILTEDSYHLDGEFAAFGKLIEGEDILMAISKTPVVTNSFNGEVSMPEVPVVIKSITVIND